nr:RNA-directed DNA polymerase, eukaryota, reverse transcriptase zinc-binding domain protein [Tanacetum cinerariifolium]
MLGTISASSDAKMGGSILDLMDNLVKVRQAMGYKMEGNDNGEGGLLCVWDTRAFNKDNVTISDYFVAIRGGLVDVPLGGYDSTWSHSSASKMSKLDRFLICEGLMLLCPNISAVCLDHYLFDHRPILLRESSFDHGPSPFCIFHFWFELDGFDNMIEKAWNEYKQSDGNAMTRLYNTLRHLKHHIRVGVKAYKFHTNSLKQDIKDEITSIDLRLDQRDTQYLLSHRKNIVRVDVVEAVKHFFQNGAFPRGCNSSFIALILKMQDAKMVKDFRPITLIGSLYKIIAKILANRLRYVLGDIVNEVQSAFVANQNIQNGPFILNELMSWCKKKKQIMVFKVDFEKAYDLVEEVGFRWRSTLPFPLSPFLFILIMESLHLSFQRVVDSGLFKRVSLGSSIHLSHLFYAEDAILLGEWSDSNITTIVNVLKYFLQDSGLRINLHKSKLMGAMMSRINSWMIELVPAKVLHTMESIRSHFFVGADIDEKKMVWASWSNVLASKHNGGLGISSFYALNRSLMFKWVWRFRTQNSSLWSRVISAIHGNSGHLHSLPTTYTSSTWTDIVREMFNLKHQDTTLKEQYPRVYALETCKSISVANKLAHSNVEVSLRRPPKDGVELHQYNNLSSRLDSIQLPMIQDRWEWSLGGTRKFTTASARKLIDDKRLPKVSYNTRGVKAIPIKFNVLAWRIGLNKLPTRLNLSLRGLDIDSISCPICDEHSESTSHLFFSCSMVKDVLRKVSMWCDITIRDAQSYDEWLYWFLSLRLHSNSMIIMEGIFYVTLHGGMFGTFGTKPYLVGEDMDTSVNQPEANFHSYREGVSSVKSGINRSFKLQSGGSILEVMENLVDVGQAMGYNMEGCMKNIEAIVGFQGDSQ